jgi:hypothetical protein
MSGADLQENSVYLQDWCEDLQTALFSAIQLITASLEGPISREDDSPRNALPDLAAAVAIRC